MNVTSFTPQDNINGKAHRKENKFTDEISAIVNADGHGRSHVVARFYWTDTRCYCCLWVFDGKGVYASGSAFAGGYGYHKASAALSLAAREAGFKFDQHFGGAGDEACRECVESIMTHLGFDRKSYVIHRAHG